MKKILFIVLEIGLLTFGLTACDSGKIEIKEVTHSDKASSGSSGSDSEKNADGKSSSHGEGSKKESEGLTGKGMLGGGAAALAGAEGKLKKDMAASKGATGPQGCWVTHGVCLEFPALNALETTEICSAASANRGNCSDPTSGGLPKSTQLSGTCIYKDAKYKNAEAKSFTWKGPGGTGEAQKQCKNSRGKFSAK